MQRRSGRGRFPSAQDLLPPDKLFRFAAGRTFDALECNFTQQHLFVDLHLFRAFARIDRARNGIGNHRNALHDVGDQRRFLQRVALRFVEQQACFERDEILFVVQDEITKLRGVVLACERVGVVTVGQQYHPYVQSFAQNHVDTP